MLNSLLMPSPEPAEGRDACHSGLKLPPSTGQQMNQLYKILPERLRKHRYGLGVKYGKDHNQF